MEEEGRKTGGGTERVNNLLVGVLTDAARVQSVVLDDHLPELEAIKQNAQRLQDEEARQLVEEERKRCEEQGMDISKHLTMSL